jgi:Superinfection immunity protein
MELLGLFFLPFFGFGFVMYFIPSIIALAKSKPNTLTIFLINFFLGWSLIGWIVALVMALREEVPPVRA